MLSQRSPKNTKYYHSLIPRVSFNFTIDGKLVISEQDYNRHDDDSRTIYGLGKVAKKINGFSIFEFFKLFSLKSLNIPAENENQKIYFKAILHRIIN